MKSLRGAVQLVVGLLVIAALCGCAEMLPRRNFRYASSVVDYLYPNQEIVEVPTIPHLSLPLRVGIAFVPGTGGGMAGHRLNEKEKFDLMNRISAEFRKLPFVKEIEPIPSAYLTAGGSFANLDQIRTMYGVNVIALISYDQVQHTDEGLMSFSYWTIVGAYIIKGEKNDTSTMIDAAIYDIPSRKMLLRAPGVSRIKGTATLVNLNEQLRADSSQGFLQASDDLVNNLQLQLDLLQAKIKEAPQAYVISHAQGYTGGGSIGPLFGMLLITLGGAALWRQKRTRS